MAKDHQKETLKQNLEGRGNKQNNRTSSVLEADLMAYMPMLDKIEADEASKLELLQTLYAIVQSFVSLGISVDIAEAICGKEINSTPKTSAELQNHIYSTYQSKTPKTQPPAPSSDDAETKGV